MSITKKDFLGIAALIVTAVAAFFYSIPAHANPLRLAPVGVTAVATTSPVFMTAGTATSTIYLDAFAAAGAQQYDKVTVLEQLTASSTSTTLNTSIEYSDGVTGVDCTTSPAACDWYVDNTISMTNASTSQPYVLSNNNLNTYTWAYASTTQGRAGGVETANRGFKALTVPVTTRYVRVIFTLPSGSTNGAVWGKLVPFKQSN